MSNCEGSFVDAPAEPRSRSTGRRPCSAARRRRGADRRPGARGPRRSARCPRTTGVWIVNTLLRRTAANASSRDRPSATSSRARSTSRNAEWPSLRCQTAGSRPSARSARTPPTPRTSSWWSRISRPRTYRMWVIGRSASSLSGMSVSSSSTGHAADLDDPDGREQVAAGQRDADRERLAERVERRAGSAGARARSPGRRAPGARPRRSSGGSSPCGTSARRRSAAAPCPRPSSCGRRRGRRGRRSRCRGTRAGRTRRRSSRSGPRAPSRGGAGTSGPRRWTCTTVNSARMSW